MLVVRPAGPDDYAPLRELAVLSPVPATPIGPAAGLTAGSDPATAVLPLPSQETTAHESADAPAQQT